MSLQEIDLTGPYALRGKKIEQLNEQIKKHVLAYDKLFAESLNFKDEIDYLLKLRVDNDAIIENQKYQLSQYAKEMGQMQEEIEALKYFAKRFLEL